MERNKKNKITQAINLVEELSWVLDSKKSISLKEVPVLLRELLNTEDSSNLFGNNSNKLLKNNKKTLVGVLPELFQDEELFKSRTELLDFAENVLDIQISRASKRSRIEYIGLIICEVTKLDDKRLSVLVDALEIIVGNENKITQMKEAKKLPNFSWNDTILKLSRQ